MRCRRVLVLLSLLALSAGRAAFAADLTIAAASDLRYVMDELLAPFRQAHPGRTVEVVFGSSGKLSTQIRHGAPFDVFLSADVAFAQSLHDDGLAAGPVTLYAIGRLVLWSRDPALGRSTLTDLPAHPALRKLALANPRHAPYGQRAREALRHAGVWDRLQPRLVFGDNVAQTAQFVDSGAASAGLVALSLVLAPPAAGVGAWTLVPADWHQPLEQGHVVLKRAAHNPLATAFVAHLEAPAIRNLMERFGFTRPGTR